VKVGQSTAVFKHTEWAGETACSTNSSAARRGVFSCPRI
jgi:hypothetical protein